VNKMEVTIKCPKCGADINIEVPKNACVAVAKCEKCGEQLCTKKGECCVICSYSEKKCKDLV
jgi:hypothetical protein